MFIVLDTNILISALWKPLSNPSKIFDLVVDGLLIPYYNDEMMEKYESVLYRPKFKFLIKDINNVLDTIEDNGKLVTALPSNLEFDDETDKNFYEVAKTVNAKIITGNLKHYPNDGIAVSPAEFLKNYNL